MLLANKIITLLDNSRPHDPTIKPPWWRIDHYCNYHRNKGYNFDNCLKLKNVIQNLINDKKFGIDGLVNNYDHKVFKDPIPKCEKEEISNANKKIPMLYQYNQWYTHS